MESTAEDKMAVLKQFICILLSNKRSNLTCVQGQKSKVLHKVKFYE